MSSVSNIEKLYLCEIITFHHVIVDKLNKLLVSPYMILKLSQNFILIALLQLSEECVY